MRTARRVMILLLLPCCVAFAQDAVNDRAITIVGADETVLPIPAPWDEEEVLLLDFVPAPLIPVMVPAIEPLPSAAPASDMNGAPPP